MRILFIHNKYGRPSGEEHASEALANMLKEHGHEVRWYTRESSEINQSLLGKIKSFFTGIYNPSSRFHLKKIIKDYSPQIVQVQNIYPLISPSIFPLLKKMGIPIVMRCPNYRLFCPSGLSLNPQGEVCEKCWNGSQLNCVKFNCLRSKFKSAGYAIRNYTTRKFRFILDNVDMFIVQSEFQKEKFISQGIPKEKIGIVPGLSPQLNEVLADGQGKWVSFVGRVSEEKGIYEFIKAAQVNPKIPFKVVGNIDSNFKMPSSLPLNIEFVGFKKGKDLDLLYAKSKIIVVPSKWYEGFPNVIIKGMQLRKPVITSNIGAMKSIIDDEINGILVPPGDASSLAFAIKNLYDDEQKCKSFGDAGYKKVQEFYSRNAIYDTLMKIYSSTLNNSNDSNGHEKICHKLNR